MRKKHWPIGLSLIFAIALSAVFLTSAVAAQKQRSLTFGLWTHHYAGDHTEGVDNHLVALEIDGWTSAWFKNSYGKETLFLGYGLHTERLEFNKNWWMRGNLYGGVLAGYGTKHPVRLGMFSPGVYPTVSIGRKTYSLEVGVMPTFWWMGLKIEF